MNYLEPILVHPLRRQNFAGKSDSTFYNDPEYINSLCSLIRENKSKNSDLLLFSYHGIPIRHLRKASPEKKHNDKLCIKSE